MRTLLVTAFMPARDSGRAVRVYGLARALALLGPLDLLYVPFGGGEPDPAYRRENITLHCVQPSRGRSRAVAYARARLRGVPASYARGVSVELGAAAADLADAHPDALVVADNPIVVSALRDLARRRPVIYNAHNLEWRLHSESDLGRRFHRRFERRLLERSAESWMVSRADMDEAAAMAPTARLRLVPNVVDVEAIAPAPPRDGQRELLFVANLAYEPNRDAVRFLLDEVMPSLWRLAPEARLTVAGGGGDGLASSDPRAELLGFVEDLAPLYARAGCVVVPLRQGGGSPLKFVEALANGLPVVATPKAAAGLDAAAGEHYVSGEATGPAFAAAVLEALDPRGGAAVAERGRRLAEAEYSVEALAARLRDMAP